MHHKLTKSAHALQFELVNVQTSHTKYAVANPDHLEGQHQLRIRALRSTIGARLARNNTFDVVTRLCVQS